MNLKFIRERQLIRRISGILGDVVKDDCATLDLYDRYLVVSTDMLHRETDFPEIMTPWQIGWMAIAVNLSDIAAMGAEPAGLLIAAGIPPDINLSFIDELFRGFKDCASTFGTKVLGGDTDSSRELTLAGCALGFVEKDLILRRAGAHPGDLLCTTGFLGSAGAGLRALNLKDFKNKFVKNLLEPQPRLKEGRALALSRSVTAMMDNSDGLALSLSDLSEVNNVGFLIREDSIPIAPGIEEMVTHREALDLALRAGGDFELVLTVKPEMLDVALETCELKIMGCVVEEGIWMESSGQKFRIEPKGYDHKIRIA